MIIVSVKAAFECIEINSDFLRRAVEKDSDRDNMVSVDLISTNLIGGELVIHI